jgi:ribosomal protein S18 acetylase RimI-like enzyme
MNPNQAGLEIRTDAIAQLAEYATVPIRFEVASVYELEMPAGGPGGFVLRERRLAAPWIKEYDHAGNQPADWALQFDLGNWGLLGAHLAGRRVGGAMIAWNSPDVDMLEGRQDLAVLWDIRVAPEARGQGVGAALFAAVEQWARARGCRWLKIETQNINVPACRFYRRQGCELGAIHRFAYPDLPDEIQLLWYKQLQPAESAADGELPAQTVSGPRP